MADAVGIRPNIKRIGLLFAAHPLPRSRDRKEMIDERCAAGLVELRPRFTHYRHGDIYINIHILIYIFRISGMFETTSVCALSYPPPDRLFDVTVGRDVFVGRPTW